ncbi:MAG: hypothetical protein LIO94_02070 [Clostridiales bacterium]|nr:hypothetical protein [Clostridiales bacterium]
MSLTKQDLSMIAQVLDDKLEEKLDKKLDEKLDEKLKPIEIHLERIDEHLERVDEHLEKLDERVEKLDERVGKLEERVGKIEEHVGKLEEGSKGMRNDINNLNHRMQKIELEIENGIKTAISILAENYVPAATHYKKSDEKVEKLEENVRLLNIAVEHHSAMLSEITKHAVPEVV